MPVSKAVKGAIKSPAGKKFLAGVGASVVDEVLDNPVVSAAEGAVLGFAVGGPIGAAGGGIAGWYLADSNTVVPVDMIAIPAYQAYMIQGNPAFEIFIRSGETIVPTGGEVRDMEQAAFEAKAISDGIARMKKRDGQHIRKLQPTKRKQQRKRKLLEGGKNNANHRSS